MTSGFSSQSHHTTSTVAEINSPIDSSDNGRSSTDLSQVTLSTSGGTSDILNNDFLEEDKLDGDSVGNPENKELEDSDGAMKASSCEQ